MSRDAVPVAGVPNVDAGTTCRSASELERGGGEAIGASVAFFGVVEVRSSAAGTAGKDIVKILSSKRPIDLVLFTPQEDML